MAIERAAGLRSYQNAPAPDVSHIVSYMNNRGVAGALFASKSLTKKDVYARLELIGKGRGQAPDCYLLGASINSVRQAKSRIDKGKFDDYYYAVLGHYCGDLSMPLYVSVYHRP